jgi:hypothetical protein
MLIGKSGDDFDTKTIWLPEVDVVGTFKLKTVPEDDKGTVSMHFLATISF